MNDLLREALDYAEHDIDCALRSNIHSACDCGLNDLEWKIDAHLKTGGWISCEERLPEEGTYVLCSDCCGLRRVGYYNADYGWLDFNAEPIGTQLYWQPLPELPKGSK